MLKFLIRHLSNIFDSFQVRFVIIAPNLCMKIDKKNHCQESIFDKLIIFIRLMYKSNYAYDIMISNETRLKFTITSISIKQNWKVRFYFLNWSNYVHIYEVRSSTLLNKLCTRFILHKFMESPIIICCFVALCYLCCYKINDFFLCVQKIKLSFWYCINGLVVTKTSIQSLRRSFERERKRDHVVFQIIHSKSSIISLAFQAKSTIEIGNV